MKIWFKHFIYKEELFRCVWRSDDNYRLTGIPQIQSNIKPYSLDDVNVWQILYYEPGNIGVYKAHDPCCDLLIIVHELFIEVKDTIEMYNVNIEYDKIIKRLEDLDIKVIDQI